MKIAKFLIFVSVLAILTVPALSYAYSLGEPLVQCGVTDPLVLAKYPQFASPCDFGTFMNLINNVVYFILFGLALPICAIMFAYAGFLMLTAGGSTEAVGKAKRIFTNAAIGLALAAASWLIINTIMSIFSINATDWDWIGF